MHLGQDRQTNKPVKLKIATFASVIDGLGIVTLFALFIANWWHVFLSSAHILLLFLLSGLPKRKSLREVALSEVGRIVVPIFCAPLP